MRYVREVPKSPDHNMLESKKEGSENLRKKRVEGHTLAVDSKKRGPSRSTFSSTQSSLTYTGPNTTVQIDSRPEKLTFGRRFPARLLYPPILHIPL
jgi:hypothetical protein